MSKACSKAGPEDDDDDDHGDALVDKVSET
jgi:hypothetical protein